MSCSLVCLSFHPSPPPLCLLLGDADFYKIQRNFPNQDTSYRVGDSWIHPCPEANLGQDLWRYS